MNKSITGCILLITLFFLSNNSFCSDKTNNSRINERLNELDEKIENIKVSNNSTETELGTFKNDYATLGFTCFIAGAFCALWAQNTYRNSWLWFFLGFTGSIITIVSILYINGYEKNRER